jgi:alanine racemase
MRRSAASNELHDLDAVGVAQLHGVPALAANHVGIELYGDPPMLQAELDDQHLDRRAASELAILAVDPHAHGARITPHGRLYNRPPSWYQRALPSYEPVARIDLTALSQNYGEVLRLVGPRVRVLAMVKADAYGHGAAAVAAELVKLGVDTLGVATLDEAEQLTTARGRARVVVFGGVAPEDAARAVRLGVEVVTDSRVLAEALGARALAAGTTTRLHVKVDTGMHRLGVAPSDAVAFVETLARTPGVEPVAVCSHFAMAESVATEVTEGQLERLTAAARALAERGLRLERHLANSAAVMTRPAAHLDMVRPGLMLYGLYPDPLLRPVASLSPVMTLEARVVRVGEVGPGEGIGYGHSFRAERLLKVATLRCGYADGYPRALSNLGEVSFGGRLAPVLGRVCMDHMMVDVSGIGDVALGSTAVLWGDGLPTEKVAERAGTIAYELVARVGARVARRCVG